MKLLTWNIWQGKHVEIIINDLRNFQADIVALQEVVEKDETHTAQIIADALGYQCAYYRTLDPSERHLAQGNAILSKYPIIDSSPHLLSDPNLYDGTAESEARLAVKTHVDVDGNLLYVFSTHLAYSPEFRESRFRTMQVKNLVGLIPKENAVLMGDFNSHPDSSYMNLITQAMKGTDQSLADPTWTVYPFDYNGFHETQLRHRLDYIFVSKNIEVTQSEVLQSKGSDHLPVLAEIS